MANTFGQQHYATDSKQSATFEPVTAFCNSLQHLATSQKVGKDMVVEHKGSSDGLLFFRSQRERGQYLPPGDRLPGVSDEWVTRNPGEKYCPKEPF
jgi:hypothetical protein